MAQCFLWSLGEDSGLSLNALWREEITASILQGVYERMVAKSVDEKYFYGHTIVSEKRKVEIVIPRLFHSVDGSFLWRQLSA